MPKISFNKLRKLLLVVLVLATIFSSGYFLGNRNFRASFEKFPQITISRDNPPGKESIDFSLFWRVWDVLGESYFDKTKLNPVKMVYGAIEGMVSSLGDPYTVFLPPEDNRIVQEDLSGSFEGVGIQIGFKGSQLAVVAPLPGSPAEAADIKAGDFIIGIKDEAKDLDTSTSGMSLPEAVKLIRGPAGTKVILTLLRDNEPEPLVVEITRAELEVPSLILTYTGDGGGYAHIRLLKFGGETDKEWQKAIREILGKSEVTGVILDVRNNPGGYLQEAVNIAAEFTKTDTLIVTEEKTSGVTNEFRTERIGLLQKMPVVVLINGGSASASEILAGALRDIRGISLIGEKTFGKGTIQEPQQLENGAGLHITIAKWLTPSGTWVNENGLEPDIAIEEDPETSEDEQLLKALEVLAGQ
jgi:carboxyl-terminal processing protease